MCVPSSCESGQRDLTASGVLVLENAGRLLELFITAKW